MLADKHGKIIINNKNKAKKPSSVMCVNVCGILLVFPMLVEM